MGCLRADGLSGQRRHEAHALHGNRRFAVQARRILGPPGFDHRRHDVNQVPRLFFELPGARLGNAGRPVRDERRGHASFVSEVLVAAERRIGECRPIHAQEHGGVRPSGRFAFEPPPWPRLGVAAVIGHEQDERVLQFPALLETIHQRPDGAVHAMHGGGVDGHDVVEPLPLALAHAVPGGRIRRTLRQWPAAVDEAHAQLPLVARLAQLVPARREFPAEPRDVLLRRHEREVRRIVRQIQEERLFGLPGLVEEAQAELRPQVRAVPVTAEFGRIQRDLAPVQIERRVRPSALVGVIDAARH